MKNTLKLLMLLLVSVGIVNCAKAQSLYIRGGIGVGLGLNPSTIGTNSTYTSYVDYDNQANSTYSYTQSPDKKSPGEGLYPEIAIGYMLNSHVGFELGFSYASGFSTTVTNDSTGTGTELGYTGAQTFTSAAKYSFHSFLITPSIVISAGGDNKLTPYGRLGMIISLASEGNMDDNYSGSQTSNAPNYDNTAFSGEEATQTTGTVQLGVAGAVGVNYKLSSLISIFGEVNVRAFNFQFDQTTITTDTYNGVDNLPNLTTSQKQINYVSSITTTNATAYNAGNPTQELTQAVPANTVGITIGIKLNLGGK